MVWVRGSLPAEVGVVPQLKQQPKLFLEQGVVVHGVVAEQWVRLDERAPPGDDFGATSGHQIQGSELLEKPHWILRGEHGDGGAQAEVGGFPGNGGEHDLGRR